MGSSMGGLLSYYLVRNHADIFGACGCVSTHFALSAADFGESTDTTPYIFKDIAAGDTVPENVRFFFDYGTETLDSTYETDHAPVRDWLLGQGLVEGTDFKMRKYEGADHSERAWRARVSDQLELAARRALISSRVTSSADAGVCFDINRDTVPFDTAIFERVIVGDGQADENALTNIEHALRQHFSGRLAANERRQAGRSECVGSQLRR